MTLDQFFYEHPKAAIAFSGGVDSAYLLYAALSRGAEVKAYYVKTAFQPEFELEDARRLTRQLGAQLRVLDVDVLCNDNVTKNPSNRCYHCKRIIFQQIQEAAKEDGFCLILDGTNASDDASDRPGMKALQEMQVRSPLRECGLVKEEIRRRSKDAELFTWDKPAYACLATRIPAGEPITQQKLDRTEKAEAYLASLGFRDFRIRMAGDSARIQVTEVDVPRIWSRRQEILATLKPYYQAVMLDLEVRG